MNLPLIQSIKYASPHQLFERFSQADGAILLESTQLKPGCGQYSFIGISPFLILSEKMIEANPFDYLQQQLSLFKLTLDPALPPFQGGVMGYFGYDLCQHLEDISLPKDDMNFPDMMLGFYDLVISFDHIKKQAWISS